MSDSNFIIETKGISKYFGAVTALEDVDFELKKGEILGLVGDNGAGKSTLIKILSGAITPNKGKIEVYGKEVKINNPQDAFRLGIETIYQDLALFNNLNFIKNIFGGREYRARGIGKALYFADDKKMKLEAMDKIKNISIKLPDLGQRTETLSGGQRQALSLIMATVSKPAILLLDEHIATLDPKTAQIVLELSEATVMREKMTTLMVTHNMEIALRYGNRLIMMHEGRIVVDMNQEQKANLTVNDLVIAFERASGEKFADDSILLHHT